ncbi:reverse transcriptase [Gossypium australe]|uniref:Reverse transcriptase n=1 Tax=Gossypium australe TaxID=47621 RepID=A0A5B6VE98_9ROSI|nr:reverse transcriptase [Gossypium australe]
MSDILGDCINEAQGAFIPERLISDNVLIAYEVLHSLKMKKSGKKGNFALKLDMSKAYDRIEWDFLAGMMKHLGFHDDWVVLIMRCVCSVSYFVCLNGMNSEWLSPSRGLRQRDPLNLYLFLICAEDASCEGARMVRDVIQEYETISGQKVNYDKSLIYFRANVGTEVKEDITRLLGVRVASSPEKYLGLPMMVGKGDRINIWNDLWLPGRENNRVSVKEIRTMWTSVNQLIETATSTWNRDLIHYVFDEITANQILAIPISGGRSKDTLVWKHEGSGEYTIGKIQIICCGLVVFCNVCGPPYR